MTTIPYIFKDVDNLIFIGDNYYPLRKVVYGPEQCPYCQYYISVSGKKYKTENCDNHGKSKKLLFNS
ncbi:hypothetical protein C8C84_3501 [Flavobacterium sp. 102]|nr:hypothetical protein C8C84_0017 [Flavobacterium sp. 102]RKS03735.1 hypothetical protein C8C84_3501 [Flavobacterium sp. 102]